MSISVRDCRNKSKRASELVCLGVRLCRSLPPAVLSHLHSVFCLLRAVNFSRQ